MAITKLTSANKKTMTCPVCSQSLSWNTSEEKIISGNRYITCSSCGQKFIIPSGIEPEFVPLAQISYTQDIYDSTSIPYGAD